MARDNFIGKTLAQKLSLYSALQDARMTGQVTEVQTAPGVLTRFDPAKTNITSLLEELEYSIMQDADFTSSHPLYAALMGNRRPGITSPRFSF